MIRASRRPRTSAARLHTHQTKLVCVGNVHNTVFPGECGAEARPLHLIRTACREQGTLARRTGATASSAR